VVNKTPYPCPQNNIAKHTGNKATRTKFIKNIELYTEDF
jgi:hypothetical protein